MRADFARTLMLEIGDPSKECLTLYVQENVAVIVFCDNQPAIAIAQEPVDYDRMKHIDIKYYYKSHFLTIIINHYNNHKN